MRNRLPKKFPNPTLHVPPCIARSQKRKSSPVVTQSSDHHEILQRGRTTHKELTDQILSKSEAAHALRQRLKPKTKIVSNHCTNLDLPQIFIGRSITKKGIIWPNLGLKKAGTLPHAPLEARRLSPRLVRFGKLVWARVGSSGDPIPPDEPPLCPLHDSSADPPN